jgi:hypothetical protein
MFTWSATEEKRYEERYEKGRRKEENGYGNNFSVKKRAEKEEVWP